MWSYLLKEDIEKFLNAYPQFIECFSDINLYETEDKIFLPRSFYKNFNAENLVKVFESKNEIIPEPTFYKFTGKLKPEQVDPVNTILDLYQKNKYVTGIIKARPAFGKTVITAYISAKLGLKTIIIIDNSVLLDQWVQAYHNFTDLKENEIGLIKQKFFTTNTPVTIATVQTLLSKVKTDMHKNFQIIDEAKYGLVVYDEVHSTTSSSKFAKASLLFRTKNILGLSATPFQSGVAEVLMKNTVGEIIYETTNYERKPEYNLHFYDSKLTGKYSWILSKISDYIARKGFYNKIIIKSPFYIKLIIDLVRERLSQGHVILVLCFTKEQVKLVSSKLDEENINHRRFYGDEKEELDKENIKVIVCTYQFTGKGFDFQQLSNIIFACNLAGKKSLIQTIGRILREYKGKIQPVADDLIDLGFPSMFLPDMKVKKSVVTNEFHCVINEFKHYEE